MYIVVNKLSALAKKNYKIKSTYRKCNCKVNKKKQKYWTSIKINQSNNITYQALIPPRMKNSLSLDDL